MPTQTTVTIAQALASMSSNLLVLDSAANIVAALPNPSLVARVASFTVSGPAQLTAAQMARLVPIAPVLHALAGTLQLTGTNVVTVAQLASYESLPGFAVASGASLTLSDTATQVAGVLLNHLAWFMNVNLTTIQLDGSSMGAYPAELLESMIQHGRAISFVPTGGHTTLNIAAAAHDLATNASSLNALGAQQALAITLTNAGAVLSAADATSLLTLHGFSVAGHGLTVSDIGANITPHLAALLGQGFGSITVTSGTLSGTAAQLLDPTMHYAAGTHAQLSTSSTASVAGAAALAALPGYNHAAGAILTVADSATNLLAGSAWLAAASAIALTGDATLSATAMAQLASDAAAVSGAFSRAGHALTVSDSLAALTALSPYAQSLANGFALNADAIANAAQLTAFAALAGATSAGHAVTVSDTASSLLALSPAARMLATSYVLSTDASVNAATANLLAALPGFSAAGHALTVTDTAAALQTLTPASLAQVTATQLGADATIGAQAAQALFAEPGFTTGGHQLTIADTATNLLALPHAEQVASTLLALSGDQTVTAATLTQLAALGIKFSAAGHAITCEDSAANLAALSPAAALLAGSEVIATSANVSAATAASLAALANLSLASGATLAVQDTVANLIALGQGAPAIVSAETLAPGSMVVISAAQAIALAGLPHFSSAGASITVADSVANLSTAGSATLAAIGGPVMVVDTAANLAANAALPLVQGAAAVRLSANSQISAAAAAQIASIPHFAAGSYALTVADTAANIAQRSAAVLQVASSAVVTDSGPIGAATADQLATVSNAGILNFQGGDQLLVQDSYAALTNPANAPGLALAARIGVLDSAADLVSAAAHNWGALNPSYTLSASGTISAATAMGLAGLGAHFSFGGYTLTVADGAAAVVSAAAALNALHVTAVVTDTAADLDMQASGLLGLGSTLTAVHVSDTTPVSATVAAGLSGLSGLLAGTALLVTDTAANVDGRLAALSALGNHVAITVSDTAADIGGYAAALATLGGQLAVDLTDTLPVTAGVAASLLPLASELAPTTQLAVTDTVADVTANIAALSSLSAALGTITLSDGVTVTAAQGAALSAIDGHFGPGVSLIVSDSPAAIAANAAGLMTLNADGRLSAVDVTGASVADVLSNASVLDALPTNVSVSDSALDVEAGLSGLAQLPGLQAITLTDLGSPALFVSVGQLAAYDTVLTKIAAPVNIDIRDAAANLSADVALGSASVLATHLVQIHQITASDAQPLTLTQAQILVPGVDDGPGSIISKFSGGLDATGVDLAHLAQIAALPVSPSAISVADTGAGIAADLGLGNASILRSNLPKLASVTATDGQPVSLSAATALLAGVDDGAQSVIGLLQGAALDVTGAAISALPSLANLYVTPASITVSDTAADISADLGSGNSMLLAGLPVIGAITVSDGQTITLTEQQVLAPHVDDGVGSVLAETTGGNLAITGVAAGDIAEMLGLGVAPTSLSITDTAARIVSNFADVVSNLSHISAITVSGAPLTLSAGEALAAHVDDGAGSLIDLVGGHAFDVTGASIAQLPLLQALQDNPTSIDVSDSSSNVVADLLSGNSKLLSEGGLLGTIDVTHGTLTLTDAQADTILTTPSLNSLLGHLDAPTVVSVTGVPIADLTSIAGSGWPHVTEAVTDSAANIIADLGSGNSLLQANAASIGSVGLSADATVTAADLTSLAGLPQFATNGFALTVQDNIANIQALAPAALAFAQTVSVVDNATDLAANLDALQAQFAGNLHIAVTGLSPSVLINTATYAADQPTIDAVQTPGVFTVSDGAEAVAALGSALSGDTAVGSVDVTDTADNVISNFSQLDVLGPKLHVSLTDTYITANLVAPLLSFGNQLALAVVVRDTGSQIAAVVEAGDPAAIAYLNTQGAVLADSTPISAADAAALETLTMFNKASHNLIVWDTVQHLTSTSLLPALANGLIDGVNLKALGNAVTVTASMAATLFGITNFSVDNPSGTPNALTVSDTAARLESNLSVLTTNLSQIANVIVSASAVVNDQTLSDLQGLGAAAAAGVTIGVRDTGAVIAGNAVAQSTGHSLEPGSWTLSGNTTLSEADAVTLAGLHGFTAGPYVITLNLNTDQSISVADANTLGTIAGALNLGSHHLIVSGSVQQLSGLSQAALSFVTPALVDTAADVAGLPLTSPLLQGSVEITGGDVLSASTASSLLGLIRTGNGPGVTASSLSFDAPHVIEDTIGNLHALVTSPAWTSNAAVETSLHLVGQASVADLVNPANTAFLSGLYGTTLGGDATISAEAASSLSALSSSIHFNRGAYHITVQDSASNLVDASNAADLGSADTVLLAGPGHLDANDAETLLSIQHLVLNTTLTIADSSANLLDGVLAGAISGSGFASEIHVQLAGPETLDAQTAEDVVSIPGFADTQNLTIADDPSYLLNSAYHPAEAIAAQVTLAGDEVVSANTVYRLSQLPHFTPGESSLILASNDFADAPTLQAVADMGAAFDHNGHSLTMTGDALDLTPTEYTALQSDDVVQNGHALGVVPAGVSLSDSNNILTASGSGLAGSVVKLYAGNGTVAASETLASSVFTISTADGGGQNFSMTEIAGGAGNEGAPLVLLDTTSLENAVVSAGGSFASSGTLQVDDGKFINLYQEGAVPVLTVAALVYDPMAHTVALDVPNHSPVLLVTLGGTTHPASLSAAEIMFKPHG